MRLNDEQIEVLPNPALIDALVRVLATSPRPGNIVEIGTYKGTGSTMVLVRAIEKMLTTTRVKKPPKIQTIEVDYGNYTEARNNLWSFSYIEVIHGLSLNLEEARDFIQSDEAIREHEKYPEFIIDNLDDPVGFYIKEIEGKLFNREETPKAEENVLSRLISEVCKKRPLFVLDGAGGCGWLEFQRVVELMGTSRYFVFLDDISHLKNFRSVLYVKRCNWPILYNDGRCLIACHSGSAGYQSQQKVAPKE